jgi:hypothetical protein
MGNVELFEKAAALVQANIMRKQALTRHRTPATLSKSF